jgi:hypothetical protein
MSGWYIQKDNLPYQGHPKQCKFREPIESAAMIMTGGLFLDKTSQPFRMPSCAKSRRIELR